VRRNDEDVVVAWRQAGGFGGGVLAVRRRRGRRW